MQTDTDTDTDTHIDADIDTEKDADIDTDTDVDTDTVIHCHLLTQKREEFTQLCIHSILPHTATHYNTLQRTATHCNTLRKVEAMVKECEERLDSEMSTSLLHLWRSKSSFALSSDVHVSFAYLNLRI